MQDISSQPGEPIFESVREVHVGDVINKRGMADSIEGLRLVKLQEGSPTTWSVQIEITANTCVVTANTVVI